MQTEQTTLHKALITIKKLKQLLNDQAKKPEPIAIIGLSCRFPQAVGKDEYWNLLKSGINVASEMPEERWQLLQSTREIFLRDKKNPIWGNFLTDITAFDAYFFGISPREALHMDPQQRLLLEVTYEAIEDAGLSIESLAGSNTGVFASLYPSQIAHLLQLETDLDALYLPTGNATSIAANRLSYFFDLRGPSLVLDTACSSSLIALHLACLHLQNKLCDTAFLCGANLNLLPSIHSALSKAKMLSPDGKCKTFSANANGYAQGEGIGAIILKPLAQALKDNDRVYAVIIGSAVNQDGRTNGLTAPSGLQQETLLKQAYASANIHPQDVSYVECHGTGTFLGDPIEIEALGEIIGKNRDKQKPCWMGSVKTNIGHLEPAAGIASIIKIALALKHSQIPPHINLTKPNPHIAFDKYHFIIPQQVEPWPTYGNYRIAGISGFGFGGTNGHVVIRELLAKENPDATLHLSNDKKEIFTLSAKDPSALKLFITRWCDYLSKNTSLHLGQICYNTHMRRSHYSYRLAIVAETTQELYNHLCNIRDNPTKNWHHCFINLETIKAPTTFKEPTPLAEIDLSLLANLYINQTQINWREYEKERHYPHIDMPLYPWQHKVYWPSFVEHQKNSNSLDDYPLQAQLISSPLSTMQFEFKFDTKIMPEIKDTYNVLHAGYYLEMLAFAVENRYQKNTFSIADMNFLIALIVPDNIVITVQLILENTSNDYLHFTFYSKTPGQKKWIEHVNGFLNLNVSENKNIDSIDTIKQRCQLTENVENLYHKIISMGMPAGDSIRWTHQYWMNENEILCELRQPDSIDQTKPFKLHIHPGLIDGCIQPIFKLLPPEHEKPFIASHAKTIHFFGIQEGPLYLLSQLKSINTTSQELTGTCYVINQHSQVLIEFDHFCLKQVDNKIQIDQIKQMNVVQDLGLSTLSHRDRKQAIIQFLKEQIAIIFSMPPADIEVNRSLRDMGLDSLMALVLLRTLEIGLGVNYSMQNLLEGPTIMEITDFALNLIPHDKKKEPSPWIAYRTIRSHPKIRLFCFPYGGAGATIYHDWHHHLPDTIEICPIQLPGRENRLNEKIINHIDVLINALIDNLQHEFDIPFAFFGHSFGALIAFQLARTLRKKGLPQPSHLFASAFPDPRLPTKRLDDLLQQLQMIQLLDANGNPTITNLDEDQLTHLHTIFNDNGIINYGTSLMNREVVNVLLPTFFGDMGIIKSYQYQDETPLNVPITVFLGKNDTWVPYEDHLKWADHTKNTYKIHEFDSDHLFIKDSKIKKDLFHLISHSLMEY